MIPQCSRAGALLVVLVAILAACATGSTNTAGEAVTFTFFGDAIESRGYEDMVAAFEAENPEVDVLTQPVASKGDLLARLTTSFAGGAPPDVFLVNFREYGQFAGQGALTDVQPFLDASTVISQDDLYEAPVQAFSFGGGDLTCMPQNVSSLVAYVNLDLFAAAGIPVPYDGWDWEDFLAAARDMTRDDVYGLGTTPDLIRIAPFVWSNGGELVDDDLSPTQLTLDSDASEAALNWFLDLSLVHQVVPPDVEEQSFDSESRFLAGRLGIYLNSRRVTPTMRQIDDFAWDVVPLPTAPGGSAVTMLHSDAYCMSAQVGQDPARAAAAWKLIEFANGPTGAPIVAASGRTVPVNRTVAESSAFLDGAPNNAQLFLDNAAIVRATPSTAGWARVENAADDTLESIWFGRIARAVGFRQLLDDTTLIFAETP